MSLDASVRASLEARGMDPVAAEHQLAVLAGPRPHVRVLRPAVLGDGITTLTSVEHLEQVAREAAMAGRLSVFVPASGAATRLFRDLLAARDGAESEAVSTLLRSADKLAFWPQLEARGARIEEPASVLRAMFDVLELHTLPKGLLPFHRTSDGLETAFDAQVAEAAALVADEHGVVLGRMSVAPSHMERFVAAARSVGPWLRMDFGVQDPRTDTVALDGDAAALDADGEVLLRPGGHGALLDHLQAMADDPSHGGVVLMKNIDNVTAAHWRERVLACRRQLVGLLVQRVDEAHHHIHRLRAGLGLAEAKAFVERVLGPPPELAAAELATWLDRPWRVAGMVPNAGEPGGGPFWVELDGRPTVQIVEGVQLDRDDPVQEAAVRGSTHFNPVDLVVALRDADGRPHDLSRWTDPAAVIVTEKSHRGRTVRAYEHPGLWNGAMARWHSCFVELPALTFQPVKTLADLLRPAHQF